MPRPRLSYANVVATLALFIALGGTSYAALTISGRDVQNGSLTGRDLRDGSVGAKDLRRSVRAGLAGPAGAPGPAGAKGDRGVEGPAGAAGAPAVSLWAVVAADGTLVRGRGVSSVSDRTSTRWEDEGNGYAIEFDRDVRDCSWVATVGIGSLTFANDAIDAEDVPRGDPAPAGYAFTEGGYGPRGFNAAPRDGRTVNVFTYADGEEPDAKPAARPFHLQVAC